MGHIFGTSEEQNIDLVGEAPNLVECLQALAEPNSVLIDARTRRLLGNARIAPPPRSDKLAVLLARTAATNEETALLAELLSLPVAGDDAAVPLTSQQKKERTFDALVRQLETLASAAPVLMVFEDAHWADPSSRELLDRIIEVLGYLRVLLVITFRPSTAHPGSARRMSL